MANGQKEAPAELIEYSLLMVLLALAVGAVLPALQTATVSTIGAEFASIGSILGSLPIGNIAFNVPSAMEIDSTYAVNLFLSASRSMDELEADLKQRTRDQKTIEKYQIRIAPLMEARLTGRNFEILAIKPETQGVGAGRTTEWQWDVAAKRGGIQELHLTLNAVLFVNKNATPISIRTFDKRVEVRVTLSRRAADFMRDYWQELLAAIVLSILISARRYLWNHWQKYWQKRKKSRAWEKPL